MAQQSWRTRKTKQTYRPHYDSETDRTGDDEPKEAPAEILIAGVRFSFSVAQDGTRVPLILFGARWVPMTFAEACTIYCLRSDRLIHFLVENCPDFLVKPEAQAYPEFQRALARIKNN